MNYFKLAIRYLLLATAFTPLIVFDNTIFPFVFSKALFFRVIIELSLILFLVTESICLFYSDEEANNFISSRFYKVRQLLRQPLAWFIFLFFISSVVSTIFAVSPYKAFWGELERSEGFFTLAHYFVFLILSLLIFKKNDWPTFLKLFVFAGGITALFSIFQYLGLNNLLVRGLVSSSRPGSFVDNPAFLASYLIFALGFAALFLKRKSDSFKYSYAYLLVIILSLISIFLSNTRGAIMGLFCGILFLIIYYGSKIKHLRKYFIISLVLLIAFVSLFFITRKNIFWTKIPGFNRLADISLSGPSVQTRLIAWGTSLRAFKEKPVFGWGLENYRVAYNKYYNPLYERYEEAWFDRAHNRILDVLVTQGLFGTFIYLSLLAMVFRHIFKYANKNQIGILTAMFIAYIVQNLFVFDQPVSYISFFVFMGFLLDESINEEEEHRLNFGVFKIPLMIVSAFIVFVLFYSLYFYNYIPYRQVVAYRSLLSVSGVSGEKILRDSDKFLVPYNYAQPVIRMLFMEELYNRQVVRKSEFDPLVNKAINALEEVVAREPNYEPREYVMLTEVYNEKGKNDPTFFKKSEFYIRKALELSPKRQDIYYLLAYVLVGEGRPKEALAVAREAVALEPDVARAHYMLGLTLSLIGIDNWPEAELELGKALDVGFVWAPLKAPDYANMEVVYKKMLSYYLQKKDANASLRIISRYRQISSDQNVKDDLDLIEKLVKDGSWAVLLNSLF